MSFLRKFAGGCRFRRLRFDVEVRRGIDGPFTEAKELVGGYWLINVKSLAEANDWAKRAPATPGQDAEIEVREFIEFE